MFNKYAVYIIAALVITGLGGFFIQAAFKAAKQSGYDACITKQLNDNMAANDAARKEVNDVRRKENSILDSDLDSALNSLGVMRDDADR